MQSIISLLIIALAFVTLNLSGAKNRIESNKTEVSPPNIEVPENPVQHVIGGTDANIANYPFVGALVENVEDDNTRQFCGCTAIDPYWVMTAAHCLDRDIGIEEFKVVFETADLGDTEAAKVFYPKAVVTHPNFANIYDFDYDIALIQLSSPLPDSITPVTFVLSEEMELPGLVARAVGWGLTSTDFRNLDTTSILQEADLSIVTREFANDALYFDGRVTEKMIPAGDFDPYRSVHSGDSGGPLLMFNSETNNWEQLAIASFGAGCAKDTNPISAFTRIIPLADWINDVIQNDFLHWVGENDLPNLENTDGDEHSPLVEWIFNLDPNIEDDLDFSVNLISDPNDPNHAIYLPLALRNEIPILDLQLEKSANLSQWDPAEIQWQNIKVDVVPDSQNSIYQIPLVSLEDGPFFSRLFLDELSGTQHGPFAIRSGSATKGILGKAVQENELNPNGPTRFDYLLEILDPFKQIEVTANAPEDVDFKIQVFALGTGTLIWELNNLLGTTSYRFQPEADETYLVRLESIPWDTPVPFNLYSDSFHGGMALDETIVTQGTITADDSPYKRLGYYTDRYTYSLGGSSVYKIELRSDTMDSILVLKDPIANQLIEEVDEEPSGVTEEFLIFTDPNSNPEIVVGNWKFGETGDYEIEVSRFTEATEARPGDNFLGIIHSEDETEEIDGETFYLDFISLKDITSSEGATISIAGLGGYIPTFALIDVSNLKLVEETAARCEDGLYYLEQPSEIVELVIIATERNFGDNYRITVTNGDTRGAEPSGSIPQFHKSHRNAIRQSPLDSFDIVEYYRSKLKNR